MSFSFFAPASFPQPSSVVLSDGSVVRGRDRGEGGTSELELTTTTRFFRPSALSLALPYLPKNDDYHVSYSSPFAWDPDVGAAPEWMAKSVTTFPIYHPPTLFPIPTYAGGIPSASTAEAFASATITTALPEPSISPTSSLSSLASLLPFDPDPEQGLVEDPDKDELGDKKDVDAAAAPAQVPAGRPKRKCVVASVVESAQSSPKKRSKKAVVKPETESEESPGNESDFEPDKEGDGTGGRAKGGKRTTTERKERRKATNRASAKAFRARRKNLLAEIQAQISERDKEIANLRSLIGRLREGRDTSAATSSSPD